MNESIIEEWNKKVPKEAKAIILGDVSMRCSDAIETLVKRLNGDVSFLYGNHDNRQMLRRLGTSSDVKEFKRNGNKFFLSHYAHRIWPASHHGSYHLYGHSHDTISDMGRSMDVGVDSAARLGLGYAPFHIDEIVDLLKDQPYGLEFEQYMSEVIGEAQAKLKSGEVKIW